MPIDLEKVWESAKKALAEGDQRAADTAVTELASASTHDMDAAACLAHVLALDGWKVDKRVTLATPLTAKWGSELRVMAPLANAFERFVDLRLLNEAPPSDVVAQRVLEFAARFFEQAPADARLRAARLLFSVARLSGRAADSLCERAAKTVIELDPDNPYSWYDYGLFLKTRGRFAEGVTANQRAMALNKERDESTIWNLGICATGAGQGQVALELWTRELGAKLKLGEDGLPTGSWHHVKVRLAERPLAQRDARNDTPGKEETVWLERLSPCHGRVLNLTFGELGVDFGDLVLFDGAAIARQEVEGKPVFVFPHLATLQRSNARIFRFVAQLPDGKDALAVSRELPEGIDFYSHTDSLILLCRECALKDGPVGECSHAEKRENRVVRGKLAIGAEHSLRDADALLQRCVANGGWLASPAFAEALGDTRRAAKEQARIEGMEDSTSPSSAGALLDMRAQPGGKALLIE